MKAEKCEERLNVSKRCCVISIRHGDWIYTTGNNERYKTSLIIPSTSTSPRIFFDPTVIEYKYYHTLLYDKVCKRLTKLVATLVGYNTWYLLILYLHTLH